MKNQAKQIIKTLLVTPLVLGALPILTISTEAMAQSVRPAAGATSSAQLEQIGCDALITGQKSFAQFQAVIDGITESSQEDPYVICLNGTVRYQGNDLATIRADASEGVYPDYGDFRFIKILGLGNAKFVKAGSDMAPLMTARYTQGIENVRFEHSVEGAPHAGDVATLIVQGEVNLKSLQFRAGSSGNAIHALKLEGSSNNDRSFDEISFDLRDAAPNSVAILSESYEMYAPIQNITIEGGSASIGIELRGESYFTLLKDITIQDVGTGIVLRNLDQNGNPIEFDSRFTPKFIELKSASVTANGAAIEIQDGTWAGDLNNVFFASCLGVHMPSPALDEEGYELVGSGVLGSARAFNSQAKSGCEG